MYARRHATRRYFVDEVMQACISVSLHDVCDVVLYLNDYAFLDVKCALDDWDDSASAAFHVQCHVTSTKYHADVCDHFQCLECYLIVDEWRFDSCNPLRRTISIAMDAERYERRRESIHILKEGLLTRYCFQVACLEMS